MKFREFEDEAKSLVSSSVKALGFPESDPEVSVPPNPSFGDLSSTIALRLAKALKERPGDVALRLAGQIMTDGTARRYVKSVSAHPSGYLNFTMDYGTFAHDSIEEILSSDSLGAIDLGRGKRVAIEHTGVNPSKAMHIGHARNLVLGDSLARIMRHCGYQVEVLNYIDDSGGQVADVIVGFRYLGISDQAPAGAKYDDYCGDQVYVKVTKQYGLDPSLKEKQSLVLQEIERGTGELAEYAASIVKKILAAQLETCWRLGAGYDLLNWESQIVHSGMWTGIFERMKSKGMTTYEETGDNKGCWVIADPDTGEQKVLVRSDGTAVYVAKDIPYAAWKVGLADDPFKYEVFSQGQPDGKQLWTTSLSGGIPHPRFAGVDLSINVIDTKQSYLQRIVSRVLEGLGEGSAARYQHRGYEVVALSKKTAASLGIQLEDQVVHMSGRKGLYVNVDTMLEALKSKALVEARRHNLGETEEWVGAVAEAVAVAALRYELVKQDPDKMIVFDVEEALRFEGDTGPYLLYSYARARRILDKSQSKPQLSVSGASKLTRGLEKQLVKKLSMFDKSLITSIEYLSPKEVSRYAHELAELFNMFYEKVPVNMESDEDVKEARLALVEATSRVLRLSMTLLGIPYKEKI